jgi:hypothetical protein
MLGVPNIDHIIAGFRKDIDRLDEKLTNICDLLERLVQLQEKK